MLWLALASLVKMSVHTFLVLIEFHSFLVILEKTENTFQTPINYTLRCQISQIIGHSEMPVAAHHHTAHRWLRHYCYHSTLKQQERSSSTSTLTFLAYTLAYWILAKRPLAAPIIEDLATCGGFSTTTVESSHGAVKAIWTNNISFAHLHCSLNVNWSTFLKYHHF